MYLLILCLIILSILYLLYRNIQYNKILESFDNTQNSLSTMYEDENYIMSMFYKIIRDSTKFNSIIGSINDNNLLLPEIPDISQSSIDDNLLDPIVSLYNFNGIWNGVWKTSIGVDAIDAIYANMFQINNNLVISLSYYYDIYKDPVTINRLSTSGDCAPNYFIGIGKLNNTKFKIDNSGIKCDNFFTKTGEKIVSLNGEMFFNNNVKTINIIITKNANTTGTAVTTNNFIFNFFKPYITHNNYKSSTSLPEIPDSEFYLEEKICQISGETPCKFNEYGLSSTVYGTDLNGNSYNACGEIMADSKIVNKCNPNKTSCVFSSPSPSQISNGTIPIVTCPEIVKNISDYMNFTPLNILTKVVGKSMYICDYLQYLDTCNSCILCYVTNIGNAYTLNYQFFGTLPGENSLTVQADMMDQMLNNSNANGNTISLLSYYRNILNAKTNLPEVSKGVSFINYPLSYTLTEANNLCNTYIEQYYGPIGNNAYSPALWSINFGSNKVNNSCNFILSTSPDYNTPVKYVTCNDDGTIGLSLYKGGNNQELVLDNSLIIKYKKTPTNTNNAVAITANIKTSNGLYLVPSMDVSGFSNNSILLKSSLFPSKNGKWLILGINTNNLDNLNNVLQNLRFDPSL